MTEEIKYDIILIGTEKEHCNYLGSRTFYMKNILKKYLPTCKVGIYDVLSDDKDRIKLDTNNYIFLPWIETIDLNWANFLINLKNLGKKVLYTDDYYWYQKNKDRLLGEGFNLENLFDVVGFSSREYSGWWSYRAYDYLGPCVYNDFFKELDIEKKNKEQKALFIDTPYWNLESSPEPYNILRILDECIPQLKEKHSNLKIISQANDRKWVDENLPKNIPFKEIINYYIQSDAYIVAHNETCGLAQFECRLCGTKIITTKVLSNHSALLPGEYTHELWSFEEGNESFINAVEKCLIEYDRKEIQFLALQAYNDELFFNNLIKNLWEIKKD